MKPDMIAQLLMFTAKANGAELVTLSFETSQAGNAAGLHSYRSVRHNVIKGAIAETIALVPEGI